MNWTNFEHALYALAVQLITFYFVGWWVGAYLGVMFLAGREYAQVEYKVRSRTGMTLTQMQPWHLIKREYWSLDTILDIVIPAIIVSSVAYVATHYEAFI